MAEAISSPSNAAMATGAEVEAKPGKLVLYNHWLSSCSQRVRIALNLKGLEYEYKAVNILKGDNLDPDFEKINPMKYVPALVDGDAVVADSFAILLYLEDKYPQYPLLPQDLKRKTLNIQVASIVSSSIQPLQNLHILNFIEENLNSDEEVKWARRHINNGFAAIEKLLVVCAGKYATGDDVQLADVFLAPQLYRGITAFQIDMTLYPTLARLHETYMEHPAFQAALPNKQPDAPLSS